MSCLYTHIYIYKHLPICMQSGKVAHREAFETMAAASKEHIWPCFQRCLANYRQVSLLDVYACMYVCMYVCTYV